MYAVYRMQGQRVVEVARFKSAARAQQDTINRAYDDTTAEYGWAPIEE